MIDHGRFLKVMFALLGAMTMGALILLGLEGKPVKPMAFSLSATQNQRQIALADSSLAIPKTVEAKHWKRVEIACRSHDEQIQLDYGPTGRLASQYHFVICGGNRGTQGKIFATQLWTQQKPCLDQQGNRDVPDTIKICLITDNGDYNCSAWQMKQIDSLVVHLVRSFKSELNVKWKEVNL